MEKKHFFGGKNRMVQPDSLNVGKHYESEFYQRSVRGLCGLQTSLQDCFPTRF